MLGEFLTAALGQNPMLWRTSPIGTELEGVVVRWLREALGLPDAFDGLLTDTASTSTLIALAAAREAAGLEASAEGLAGREDVARVRVYASAEAHSSIEKACMTLGLGRAALVKIRVNDRYEMDPAALAAAIAEDRAAGLRPIADRGHGRDDVVDVGGPRCGRSRTSRSARDSGCTWTAPTPGVVALLPDRRAPFTGWERADSIVVNPHKWLFTPLDASLLLTRRMDDLRAAFSLVPEYLRTLDRSRTRSSTTTSTSRSWAGGCGR